MTDEHYLFYPVRKAIAQLILEKRFQSKEAKVKLLEAIAEVSVSLVEISFQLGAESKWNYSYFLDRYSIKKLNEDFKSKLLSQLVVLMPN